jgi:hypothetical protein
MGMWGHYRPPIELDARENESRAALHSFLSRCGDGTMLQCKTNRRRNFPKERFDFQMMGAGEAVRGAPRGAKVLSRAYAPYRRRSVSSFLFLCFARWIPAYAGMTDGKSD